MLNSAQKSFNLFNISSLETTSIITAFFFILMSLETVNTCSCGCDIAKTTVIRGQIIISCAKCSKIRYKSWF